MFFSRLQRGNMNLSQNPQTGVESVTFVDSLTLVLGIRTKMSMIEGAGCLISLPILLLCAIIAIAIIAEQFG